ncbi:MAG TPA: ABC transporter permease [Sediminispirochaeta sp.]|nr:ABC transporter permease [Sediminispirochaeta sp.]
MRFSLFSLLCLAASFSMPLVVLKENRIVTGRGVWLFQINPLFAVAAGLLLILMAFLLYKGLWRGLQAHLWAFFLFLLIFSVLLHLQQNLSKWDLPAMGRVSFAGGFWFSLFCIYLLLSWAYRQTDSAVQRYLVVFTPLPLLLLLLFSGVLQQNSIYLEYVNRQSKFFYELLKHIKLTLTAVGAAACIGVPVGVMAARYEKWRDYGFRVVNSIQTIPSLAFFGLMIAPLALLSRSFPVLRELGISGIGEAPALIALSLYALLPIVRNTFTGLFYIDQQVKLAAVGMGMNKGQVFRSIELPLAAPMILTGLRISLVQTTGNTVVAALIGAGGMGTFIFQGLGQSVPDLILLGVIPVIILSVFFDRLFFAAEGLLTPKGLRVS